MDLFDIILAIDGVEVASVEHLIEILKNHRVGDNITLSILRGKELLPVNIKLAKAPENTNEPRLPDEKHVPAPSTTTPAPPAPTPEHSLVGTWSRYDDDGEWLTEMSFSVDGKYYLWHGFSNVYNEWEGTYSVNNSISGTRVEMMPSGTVCQGWFIVTAFW